MKKTIITLLSLLMLLSVTSNSFAFSQHNGKVIELSDLVNSSPEECVIALQSADVTIPKVYDDTDIQATAVKQIIDDYYYGRIDSEAIPYNYTGLVELSDTLIKEIEKSDNIVAAKKYKLINSTVIGKWKADYKKYNCYGYALGKKKYVNPGYYSNNKFNMSYSISKMANLVCSDLDALGYNSYKTDSKPTLKRNEQVICIRKGNQDYHFMRGGTSVSTWKHKPGGTNPLKWNYSSPAKKTWTNEYSKNNVEYAGSITYTSKIYYIVYWPKGVGPNAIKTFNTIVDELKNTI